RHLRRYREVLEVLGRHGFAVVADAVGLRRPWPRRRPREPVVPGPVHLRQALEELGPTFVKLGQVLSLRADLLPREYLDELDLLQDRVPPQPFEASRAVIERELGAPLERLFRHVDPEPLASASLGQVHGAELPDGRPVVVKVLRQGVEATVRTDLEIIQDLARLAAQRLGPLPFDPVELADEFARIMRRELDYRVEARQIQRFRRNFRGDGRIRIPRVYVDRSSARVLTMERLRGARITDFDALERMGVDRRRLARTGAEIFLKMVLVDRYFHGDPHPGNLLVLPGGQLGLLDFGMVASLRPELTEQIARTFMAAVRQDPRGAVRSMRRMGIVPPTADRAALERDLEDLIARNYGRPIRELSLGEVVADSLEMVARHRLRLPGELLLLARALTILDGLARTLDPGFNALEVAVPFARRLWLRRLRPGSHLAAAVDDVQELVEVTRTLPERVDPLLEQVEAGRLTLGLRLDQETHPASRRADRAANRLALAVLAAGLAVAGGVMWGQPATPKLLGVPVLAAGAVTASMLAAAMLAWAIWRSGRL
ncbi:MAG: AarF/ABC1/UbiB kinase family protein, partial [Firmicutes bacterium]|nr:AarF/ABC1/UbiB kinase family protein [Bacillota bacterium]